MTIVVTCYLGDNGAENGLRLFPVVSSWTFSLVCEPKHMGTHGCRGTAGMFFGTCVYCVLSPMSGFRRCVKSTEDAFVILKLVLDFWDALDSEESIDGPGTISVAVCLHQLCLACWCRQPIFSGFFCKLIHSVLMTLCRWRGFVPQNIV